MNYWIGTSRNEMRAKHMVIFGALVAVFLLLTGFTISHERDPFDSHIYNVNFRSSPGSEFASLATRVTMATVNTAAATCGNPDALGDTLPGRPVQVCILTSFRWQIGSPSNDYLNGW